MTVDLSLVEFAAHATLLFAVAFALTWVGERARRMTAATQHFVWLATFTAVVATVPLRSVLPQRPILPAQPLGQEEVVERDGSVLLGVTTIDDERRATGNVGWVDAVPVVVTVWWIVGGLILVRIALAHVAAQRLRQRSSRAGERAGIPLCISSEVVAPVVTGVVHPTIVVPPTFRDWPRARADAALEHELAHVRRRDLWTSLWVDLCMATLWFHPLAWMARGRFGVARERACDDAAARSSQRGEVEFAGDLLAIARTLKRAHSSVPRCAPTTALGMASRANLELRIAALVDPGRPRAERCQRILAWAIGTASLALSVAIAPLSAVAARPSQHAVEQALQRGNVAARLAALEELLPRATRDDYAHVTPRAYDADPRVRALALDVLAQIGCMPAMLVVVHALDDADVDVRRAAIDTLARFHHPRWWDALDHQMRPHIYGGTRVLTDRALRARETSTCRDRLERAAQAGDRYVRSRAADLLARI